MDKTDRCQVAYSLPKWCNILAGQPKVIIPFWYDCEAYDRADPRLICAPSIYEIAGSHFDFKSNSKATQIVFEMKTKAKQNDFKIILSVPKLLQKLRNRKDKSNSYPSYGQGELDKELELDPKSFNPSKKISDNGSYNLRAESSPVFFENEKKRKSNSSDYLTKSDLDYFRQMLGPEVADELIRRQEEKRKK